MRLGTIENYQARVDIIFRSILNKIDIINLYTTHRIQSALPYSPSSGR